MRTRSRLRTYALLAGAAGVVALAAFDLPGFALLLALVVFFAWAVPETDRSRDRTGRTGWPAASRRRTYGLLAGIVAVITLAALELPGLALPVALVVFFAWAVPEIDPSRNRNDPTERSDDGPDLGPPVI